MSGISAGFRALPLPIAQLSLATVLKCGQSFRWSIFPLPVQTASNALPSSQDFPTHEYRLCLRDRVVCLQQTSDTLLYRAVFPEPPRSSEEDVMREAQTLSWIRDYFQLNVDLLKLYDEWSHSDKVFERLKDRFSGIRMLRQDPWENLVSFICSSNNHISRITNMVKSLCKQYSPPLLQLAPPGSIAAPAEPDENYHPFPSPTILAEPTVSVTLRSLGFGYRANFIQRTARMLVDAHGSASTSIDGQEAAEKWLMTLRDLETSAAREELLNFVGVGRKVADCVLLMSLDKREVIPVDTHVHQIAIKHYGLRGSSTSKAKAAMTPKLYDEVNTKLTAVWGEYAGWAHSVLFTADLKAFASYGLPSSSPEKMTSNRSSLNFLNGLPTPSPTPLKRKRGRSSALAAVVSVRDEDEELPQVIQEETITTKIAHDENLSMVERVKKRKRLTVILGR